MLPNFEIVNFRTFRHLKIERLGRVNLIVGKNGVGKTTLLEALRFFGMGSPIALRECLTEHDEWASPGVTGDAVLDVRALFHGRDIAPPDVEIGLLTDDNSRLRIRLIDIERVEESDGSYHFEEADEEAIVGTGAEILKGVIVQRKNRRVLVPPEVSRRAQIRRKYVGPTFVRASGVPESDLTYWWETIALTPSGQEAIDVVSLLVPIDGVATTEDPGKQGSRVFRVRLRDEAAPVPLKSLGGGAVRLFEIAVAMEYSYLAEKDQAPSFLDERDETPWRQRSRLLLVDEIENGIHYAAHADVWRAIFRIAQRNDMQVFATTHSWDCIRGFQEAAAADTQADGVLIRLESGRDKFRAVAFGEEELAVVTRDRIEVR